MVTIKLLEGVQASSCAIGSVLSWTNFSYSFCFQRWFFPYKSR